MLAAPRWYLFCVLSPLIFVHLHLCPPCLKHNREQKTREQEAENENLYLNWSILVSYPSYHFRWILRIKTLLEPSEKSIPSLTLTFCLNKSTCGVCIQLHNPCIISQILDFFKILIFKVINFVIELKWCFFFPLKVSKIKKKILLLSSWNITS